MLTSAAVRVHCLLNVMTENIGAHLLGRLTKLAEEMVVCKGKERDKQKKMFEGSTKYKLKSPQNPDRGKAQNTYI